MLVKLLQFVQNTQSLLLVLALQKPESVVVLHHVSQHTATEEDEVFASGRVIDAQTKFAQTAFVALQHVREVPLLDVLL